ncbi:RNA polymerase sigma factor [Bacteroidota bacterium]
MKRLKNIHQELIDACRHNERKAQFEIYKLYYKAMYNTSLRIIGNRTDAEDIMQESFLDAFRKIDTYNEESSFGAWLKRIVINKSIDALKKSQDFKEIIENEDQISNNLFDEDPVEILSWKVENIRQAIENLSDRYRVILSLYLLEGYDHEEISLILDMKHGAVRTKYSRARQKLLQEIKKAEKNHNQVFN